MSEKLIAKTCPAPNVLKMFDFKFLPTISTPKYPKNRFLNYMAFLLQITCKLRCWLNYRIFLNYEIQTVITYLLIIYQVEKNTIFPSHLLCYTPSHYYGGVAVVTVTLDSRSLRLDGYNLVNIWHSRQKLHFIFKIWYLIVQRPLSWLNGQCWMRV